MKKTLLLFVILISSLASWAQSGFYLPTVTPLSSLTVATVDSARFILVDSMCYVYGRFVLNPAGTPGQVTVSITPPFPLQYNVHHTISGNCFVFQTAATTVIGQCSSTFLHLIQASFTPGDEGSAMFVDYFFTFQLAP